jgi:hypothetical protein
VSVGTHKRMKMEATLSVFNDEQRWQTLEPYHSMEPSIPPRPPQKLDFALRMAETGNMKTNKSHFGPNSVNIFPNLASLMVPMVPWNGTVSMFANADDERNNLCCFEYLRCFECLRQPRAQARPQHGQSVGPKPAHKDSPSPKVGWKNGAIVRA